MKIEVEQPMIIQIEDLKVQESFQAKVQRIVDEFMIPKEDINTMEELQRVIRNLPDQRYHEIGVAWSHLEIRQLEDVGAYTYMGEWYLYFIKYLGISTMTKRKDLESWFGKMEKGINASS